jgi:hypothetical protein
VSPRRERSCARQIPDLAPGVLALSLLVAHGAMSASCLPGRVPGGAAAGELIALQSQGAAGTPRVSAHGSDLSDLPQLYPDGDWVPIEAPILSMAVLVKVKVNGDTAVATLDTGAMTTTMSAVVAERLGIIDEGTPRGRPVRAIDAHGSVIMGEKLRLGELAIGRHRWIDVEVTVLGDAPDLFLVGADLLREVDLYIAADEGMVGVFDAGRGPVEAADRVVRLERSDRQLVVTAQAKGGAGGTVRFPLIVDTGAWNTSVPLLVGINGGLSADLGYESTTVAVGGEQTNRGRFVLDPMTLGPDAVPVGRVLAIGSTLDNEGGIGLLGNDVMMRQHTIVSFRRAELRLRSAPMRPPTRDRGPGGVTCSDAAGTRIPCVSVAIVTKPDDTYEAADLPGACLKIDVDESFSGKTLELAITGVSNDLMNGGAIRAFMTANDAGAHACFHLWRQLEKLGIGAGTPLSLRWVRTEGVQWPCDPMKTRCITFTGPLAKLPTR